jgi:hypothetical protein
MSKASLASRLTHVKPGQLLTTEFYNSLIDAIQDQDQRLADLEKRCGKPAKPKATKRS